MALTEAEWVWLVRVLPNVKREVMLLRYVEGLLVPAIATTLEIRESTVRVHIHQSWLRFSMHAWPDGDLDYVRALLERAAEPDAPDTDWTHARAVLQAMGGHRPSAPATPTYDEQGRQVGCRGTAVDLRQVKDYIQDERAYREQYTWGTVPATADELKRIGPFRG